MAVGGLKLDLDPTIASQLRGEARLRARRQFNEERYAADPWAFLCEAVKTLDQRGGQGGGVRPYPGTAIMRDVPCQPVIPGVCVEGGCTNYLHHATREWQAFQWLIYAKSRRLLLSWTMVALHYWMVRYRPASFVGFAARKQGQTEDEGSAELVKRVNFIHTHLPIDVMPRQVRYGYARFQFLDNDSVIVGVAQGADQARQYTFTAYLADEFAFWERAAETYAALKPTLEGGGKFTGITSAAPGFAESLVHDRWNTSAE